MIRIVKCSGVFQLVCEQKLNASREVVWSFLSDARNLSEITPREMNFKITSSEVASQIYPGFIISYRVSPLPFFRTNWVTEITQVHAPDYFIDEQRVGPYKMWHHEHHIEDYEDGVVMRDIITYKLPLGIIGNFLAGSFVKGQLMNVFKFREQILSEKFNS